MRIFLTVVDDGLLFPVLEPEVSGNPAVMLIDPAITLFPAIEFAAGYPEPVDESSCRELGPTSPVMDKVDDLVPGIMGNPGTV